MDIPIPFNCATICATDEEERLFRRKLEKNYTRICSFLDDFDKKKFHKDQIEWENNLGKDYYIGAYLGRLFYLKEDYKKRMEELKKIR